MRVVIVKHENCGQKYLFEVPKDEYVSAGDLVRVMTKKGEQLATCLCDGFDVDADSPVFGNILSAFGGSKPLARVIGLYRYYGFSDSSNELENNIEKSKNNI